MRRLLDAGALYIGKTNLDQFATGVNGTRTPYPIPRSVYGGEMISGGSSSGSAQAFQAVPRLHAIAVVAAILPNLAQWASGLIDNALNAAGTSASQVGAEALNGAGVVYEGLQTLGEGAVLVGLILGTMVTFILEKKFLYAAIPSAVGRRPVVHRAHPCARGGVGGQSPGCAGVCILRNRLRRLLIPAGCERSGGGGRIRYRRGPLVRDERDLGVLGEDHVHPAPGIGALEAPLVAGSGGVLGEQNVAWAERELLTVSGREVQGAGQRHDELTYRRGVPGQRSAGGGLLDGDMRDRHDRRHLVGVAARRHVESADLNMRRVVVARPQANASDHFRLLPAAGSLPCRLMDTATVIVTVLLAVLFTFSASIKLLGVSRSLAIRDHLGVKPLQWRLIGACELAGVAGVLIGLLWPPLGIAAAIGLALLSVGAIAFHLRASDGAADTAPAVIGIALAVATAVLHTL